MSENRYYYYDHESCSFVEVNTGRKKILTQIAVIIVAALGLACGLTWGLDHTTGTPQELALEAENKALRKQLGKVDRHMDAFQSRLKKFAETDQEIYRTILEAEPISENVRQAGVGGADPYEKYDRFSKSTASLLRETSAQVDALQRRINLQSGSYRDLAQMAQEREAWLAQMPVLLPVDGPLVSGFGRRLHPMLGVKKMHSGIDLVVNKGTPVVATGNGVIKRATFGGGYGNFVEVKHPETKYTTLYAHLSEIPDTIRAGQRVERGAVIAYSGSTGRSTGPHLHYEVRKDGQPINPVYFFMPSMTPDKYQKLLKQANASEASLD